MLLRRGSVEATWAIVVFDAPPTSLPKFDTCAALLRLPEHSRLSPDHCLPRVRDCHRSSASLKSSHSHRSRTHPLRRDASLHGGLSVRLSSRRELASGSSIS